MLGLVADADDGALKDAAARMTGPFAAIRDYV